MHLLSPLNLIVIPVLYFFKSGIAKLDGMATNTSLMCSFNTGYIAGTNFKKKMFDVCACVFYVCVAVAFVD